MNRSNSYKSKQFFFVLIKLSIVVWAFYFIINKLANNSELRFSDFINYLSKKNIFFLKNGCLLLLLSIANWFLEILKWQILASVVEKIRFKNAMAQSLGALTASIITPNRIGEYGAKAIFYPKGSRKRIMLLNLVGNLSQMLATIIFGVIGLSLFISNYNINLDYTTFYKVLVITLLIIAIIGFGIKKSKFTVKGFSMEKIRHSLINLSKKVLLKTLLLSILRYVIFSFQFYFFLHIFNVEMGYLNAMTIISSMYLLASVIPSITIFDVVIKGSVALFLFSFANVEGLTILSITTLMWIFNFVIPSLFGSYYVLNFKLPKAV
ncbi:lysylphosphatidylglycerol synthase domain-containing protein [Seonamhaeicola sp. ML3]|uniref:lysylphosphatidylglycerol synthase domain-containing protein n=1 Tax=Seonamhaeicola sp. ML3 TaxID=2937786 RepID=UPI00200DC5CE|nr:lysylphosphatidylglycerol synthase domain-containing protein [Seonamhaeicola sp. ML3]